MSSKYPDPNFGISFPEYCPDWCKFRKWDNEKEEWVCDASRNECLEFREAIREKMKEETR